MWNGRSVVDGNENSQFEINVFLIQILYPNLRDRMIVNEAANYLVDNQASWQEFSPAEQKFWNYLFCPPMTGKLKIKIIFEWDSDLPFCKLLIYIRGLILD